MKLKIERDYDVPEGAKFYIVHDDEVRWYRGIYLFSGEKQWFRWYNNQWNALYSWDVNESELVPISK